MRFEGPNISQIVALTGFVLSVAVNHREVAAAQGGSELIPPEGDPGRCERKLRLPRRTGCAVVDGLRRGHRRARKPLRSCWAQATAKWAGNRPANLEIICGLCSEETMSRFLADIMLSLAIDRYHMQESLERVIKSSADHGKLQERIRASQLLIQRARTRWPTSMSTLSRLIGTSRCQSVSADRNKSSSAK